MVTNLKEDKKPISYINLKKDTRDNISPLLKKVKENGFDPGKKYTIEDIYGHSMQKAIGLSKWGVYAHRNSTGAKNREYAEQFRHVYRVDEFGRRYLETNFRAWVDHPKNFDNDPIGTKYNASTLMEFYRPTLTDDFEFIGFSGGKDSFEKVTNDTIRMYLQW
jgi:hypothetical protein